MKKINVLLILILFLSSCSKSLELKNLKTDNHKFVKNTRVLISPIEYGEYRRTTSYNGFEEMMKSWKLKIMSSPKSIEELDKAYNEDNLRKSLKAEFIEKMEVFHPNGYKGFYINYKEPKKKEIIHLMILQLENGVIRVKGTYSEQSPEVVNDMVRKSVQEVYIASIEEAVEFQKISETIPNKDNNIFRVPDSRFKFAGELDSYYYFSKDGVYPTNSPDSSWIAFKPIWNASKSQYRDGVFEQLLGSGFEVTKTDERGRNDIVWLAKNSDKTKMAIAGLVWGNNVNAVKGIFKDDFEENSVAFINMAMETRMK